MKSDFSDIRFTALDGISLLSFWLESETDGVTATFWVKIPSIPLAPNSISIYMYYGNPTAVTASNGNTTFTLFDTFGSGDATPGDWNLSYNNIGEHGVIKNNKLYAPITFQDSTPGGLAIVNPADGTVLKHYTIAGDIEAAPAIDRNGYIHVYALGDKIYKINENTGVVNSVSTPGGIDWEKVPYDPINDLILLMQNGTGLRAYNASDYSIAWTNTNVALTGGNGELDPPLIIGHFAYFMDIKNKFFKIALDNNGGATPGQTVASSTVAMGVDYGGYGQPIYDSVNNRIYVTDSQNKVYAFNASDLSLIWSKTVDVNFYFYRGGAYHNNILYEIGRQYTNGISTKVYALDAATGNIIWTNTSPYDDGFALSSLLVDDNYAYGTSYDYTHYNDGASQGFLYVINLSDGSLAEKVPLIHGVASSIPAVYGGKIIIGLWDTSGYQALQVRSGGGTGDFAYKADDNMTGYIGPYMSGPLVSHTTCDYSTLDPSKWTASKWYSIANCAGLSTANISEWTNYVSSLSTFSKTGFAVRVKSKSTEANSNSWDSYFGLSGTIGSSSPISFGDFNGNVTLKYDQNGVTQTVTGPPYSQDQYNTAEVKMAYPSLQFDVNDLNIASTSSWSTSYGDTPLRIGNYNSRSVVDWVFARPYVYPEPGAILGPEISDKSSSVSSNQLSITNGPPIPSGASIYAPQIPQETYTSPVKVSIQSSTSTSCTPSPWNQSAKLSITSAFTRDLTFGSKGSDVKQLQSFLIANNAGPSAKQLAKVGSTGNFFSLTKTALSEYQKTVCIPSTGYFGVITRGWLGKVL